MNSFFFTRRLFCNIDACVKNVEKLQKQNLSWKQRQTTLNTEKWRQSVLKRGVSQKGVWVISSVCDNHAKQRMSCYSGTIKHSGCLCILKMAASGGGSSGGNSNLCQIRHLCASNCTYITRHMILCVTLKCLPAIFILYPDDVHV